MDNRNITYPKVENVKKGNLAMWLLNENYQDPIKEGYIFKGWLWNGKIYTHEDITESSNPFGPITDNITIYAQYEVASP